MHVKALAILHSLQPHSHAHSVLLLVTLTPYITSPPCTVLTFSVAVSALLLLNERAILLIHGDVHPLLVPTVYQPSLYFLTAATMHRRGHTSPSLPPEVRGLQHRLVQQGRAVLSVQCNLFHFQVLVADEERQSTAQVGGLRDTYTHRHPNVDGVGRESTR